MMRWILLCNVLIYGVLKDLIIKCLVIRKLLEIPEIRY